ncbi:DUF2262 domain-containing protein [Clostridium sp. P21]|uniref:DUF2262 domain-containing protein n=1 Tax=Clostridium muellerianum TaxID=2716538 RepID=A0A7Y0EFC4_9CLOT|nr:DUF2262 domain-containing protein [Clostridium muellerianum]NMM62454.1 DUF2262 domain-containing protein [Clostridium muellerianum]
MSKNSEVKSFENRFSEEIFEVAAVTASLGVGAGKAGGEELWRASIDLIAWKDLNSSEPVVKEEVSLDWITDDKGLKEWQKTIKESSIIKIKLRKGERSFMLVELIDADYKDEELQNILLEDLKPVSYEDELLGKFKLDKGIKLFKTDITWAEEKGRLYFDLDEEETMKASLKTAHELFKNQKHWSDKIRSYAASELLELANDWIDEEDDIDEVTDEMFIESIELDTISVYPKGEFEIFFFDGDLFAGHCIIVSGNINGNLDSAEIAG